MDHYLRGRGRPPGTGATAFVETCPRERPSIGPSHAASFAQLTHRVIRLRPGGGAQTVSSSGGDPAVGQALDPVSNGDSCVRTDPAKAPGTARYTLLENRRRPVTLIGSARLRARLDVSGVEPSSAQLDGRLWDVAPDGGSQVLVARGTYRPRRGANRWQLHPGAWRLRPGHSLELELLGSDAPYARPSNGDFEIEVRGLRARLPAR
jgi:hypothetical protein